MEADRLPPGRPSLGETGPPGGFPAQQALPVSIAEVLPPERLGCRHAESIAEFLGGLPLDPNAVAKLAGEPRQQNAVVLLARHVAQIGDRAGEQAVGYIKLQSIDVGEIAIRQLVVDPLYRRRGVGTKLVDYARRNLPHDRQTLVAAADEADVVAHVFLRQLGFVCRDPRIRTRRERELLVYVFELRNPWFARAPRFTC